MVLTMVSKSELEAEKQRIRNNAIVATQQKYEQQVEELERQLEAQTITTDAYGEQLQNLQRLMDQYNEMVENLADKYARTDYDQIDAIDQEINLAIEEGLFDKADSLIRTKGNIEERHQKALEWSQSSKKQKKALDDQIAQWEDSEASRLKELENLAEDYYHSFTIELSRMNPEKAVDWLVKRSELAPQRFVWLIEVGKYYSTYLAKYNLAMEYFERAHKIAKKTKNIPQLMLVLNEKAGIYRQFHDLKHAEKNYLEVLNHAKQDSVTYCQTIATIYNNLGMLENEQKHYGKALEYYGKALSIVPDSLLTNAVYVYSNISAVYHYLDKYDLADHYLDKAIEIATRRNDKLILSTCIQNKGTNYNEIGKYNEAISYYEKALALQNEMFPKNHPSRAVILENISTSYYNLSRYKESLDYSIQALLINQNVYGEMHPSVASCYRSISVLMLDAGQYNKALSYINKSWDINKVFYSEQSDKYASHCNDLGRVYNGLKQDSLAVEYYKKSLMIYETIGMDKTTYYATVCNNISTVLSEQKKYGEAIEYSKKFIDLILSIKGTNNTSYLNGLNNLANIYDECGRQDTALVIYRESEDLILKVYGKWNKLLSLNYNNVGNIYINLKDYEKARTYFLKSIQICDSIYKQPTELSMICIGNIAMTYYRAEKWKEAIPWIEKAAAIRLQIVEDENRRYSYHTYILDSYAQLAKSENKDDIDNYKACQDSLWVGVRINPGNIAATKYGLNGDYLMMKFGDWEHGDTKNFVEVSEQMQNVSPKEMVIYRDGKFEKIIFEEKKIGITFYVKLLRIPEAKTIKESYMQWKNDNGKS